MSRKRASPSAVRAVVPHLVLLPTALLQHDDAIEKNTVRGDAETRDGWMRWTTCVARSCCWLLLHDVKQYAIWSTVYESMKYLNEICSEISTTEIKDHKLKETPLMNFKINAPNQLTN